MLRTIRYPSTLALWGTGRGKGWWNICQIFSWWILLLGSVFLFSLVFLSLAKYFLQCFFRLFWGFFCPWFFFLPGKWPTFWTVVWSRKINSGEDRGREREWSRYKSLSSSAFHSEGWEVMLWFLYEFWDVGLSPGKGKTFKLDSGVGAHSSPSSPNALCLYFTKTSSYSYLHGFCKGKKERRSLLSTLFFFPKLIKSCSSPIKKPYDCLGQSQDSYKVCWWSKLEIPNQSEREGDGYREAENKKANKQKSVGKFSFYPHGILFCSQPRESSPKCGNKYILLFETTRGRFNRPGVRVCFFFNLQIYKGINPLINTL